MHSGLGEKYIHNAYDNDELIQAYISHGIPGHFTVHSTVYSGLLDLKLIRFTYVGDPTFMGRPLVVTDKNTKFPVTWDGLFKQ